MEMDGESKELGLKEKGIGNLVKLGIGESESKKIGEKLSFQYIEREKKEDTYNQGANNIVSYKTSCSNGLKEIMKNGPLSVNPTTKGIV